jgi:hypothetical protein
MLIALVKSLWAASARRHFSDIGATDEDALSRTSCFGLDGSQHDPEFGGKSRSTPAARARQCIPVQKDDADQQL